LTWASSKSLVSRADWKKDTLHFLRRLGANN
jgi:hypothetical protein